MNELKNLYVPLRCFAIAQHDGDTVILSATKVSLLRFFSRYAPSEWRMFSMVQYDGESVILSETKDLRCYKMFRFAQHDELKSFWTKRRILNYKSANRSSASPSSASAAASISRILWRTSLDFSNSFAASSLLPALIFSTQFSKSE